MMMMMIHTDGPDCLINIALCIHELVLTRDKK